MVNEREQMRGVDAWEGHEDLVALHDGRGLPFVDFPGTTLPRDAARDRLIVAALKQAHAMPRKNAVLDYDQSEALYRTVRHYFDGNDPLMNTERWMGEFVQKNNVAYTDKDGSVYRLVGGVRRPLPSYLPDEDDDEDDEDDVPETDVRVI